MHLHCVICRDIFRETDTERVFATSCGHLFHYKCISQWFKRSESCPACRHGQSISDIIQIYFSFPSNTAPDETITLKKEVNNLSHQLILKDVEIKNLNEAKEQENGCLRDIIQKMKDETEELKNKIAEYERDLDVFKEEKSGFIKLVTVHHKEKLKLKNEVKKINEDMLFFYRIMKNFRKLKEDIHYSKMNMNILRQTVQDLKTAINLPDANSPRVFMRNELVLKVQNIGILSNQCWTRQNQIAHQAISLNMLIQNFVSKVRNQIPRLTKIFRVAISQLNSLSIEVYRNDNNNPVIID